VFKNKRYIIRISPDVVKEEAALDDQTTISNMSSDIAFKQESHFESLNKRMANFEKGAR